MKDEFIDLLFFFCCCCKATFAFEIETLDDYVPEQSRVFQTREQQQKRDIIKRAAAQKENLSDRESELEDDIT